MKSFLCSSILFFTVQVSLGQTPADSKDWKQFRGNNRDAISTDRNLLKDWPQTGPKLLWKTEKLGDGFSSISTVADKIFTMGDIKTEKSSYVFGLDRASGKILWQTMVGKEGGNYSGTRCTPCFSDGKVYALGQFGDLVCLNAADGKEVWRKNFNKDFGGKSGGWNYTESPLIDGDSLICTPGGKDNTVVALNKATGATVWACPLDQTAGYSSIVISTIGNDKFYVQLLSNELVGIEAKTGKVAWKYGNDPAKFKSNTANIPTPIPFNDKVYAAAGYGRGAGLVQLTKSAKGINANEVYFSKDLTNKHGGVIKIGDFIFSDRDDSGNPQCAEVATGKVLWKRPKPENREAGKGSASMVFADGHLYIRYDNGVVALVEASPKGYVEKGSFKIPNSDKNSWNHPVVIGGKLYLKEKDTLWCYDVSAKGAVN